MNNSSPEKQKIIDYYNKQLQFSNTLKKWPVSTLDSEHYLLELTNTELMEMLKNPSEWSKQDLHLAEKILSIRNNHLHKNKKRMNVWVILLLVLLTLFLVIYLT